MKSLQKDFWEFLFLLGARSVPKDDMLKQREWSGENFTNICWEGIGRVEFWTIGRPIQEKEVTDAIQSEEIDDEEQ